MSDKNTNKDYKEIFKKYGPNKSSEAVLWNSKNGNIRIVTEKNGETTVKKELIAESAAVKV